MRAAGSAAAGARVDGEAFRDDVACADELAGGRGGDEPAPAAIPLGAAGSVGRHVCLVGMMGAGKTTTGRLLAHALHRPFFDLDAVITARSGRSVPELFAEMGEATFRETESGELARLLSGDRPAVISVGGGAVLHSGNRERMAEQATVVWLRARVATLVRRVGDGRGRPLLAGGAEQAIDRLESDRRHLYREVALAAIDTDEQSPSAVVAAVLASLAAVDRGEGAAGSPARRVAAAGEDREGEGGDQP